MLLQKILQAKSALRFCAYLFQSLHSIVQLTLAVHIILAICTQQILSDSSFQHSDNFPPLLLAPLPSRRVIRSEESDQSRDSTPDITPDTINPQSTNQLVGDSEVRDPRLNNYLSEDQPSNHYTTSSPSDVSISSFPPSDDSLSSLSHSNGQKHTKKEGSVESQPIHCLVDPILQSLAHYDMSLRPGFTANETDIVSFQLVIHKLGSLSENSMSITSDIYLTRRWMDVRLVSFVAENLKRAGRPDASHLKLHRAYWNTIWQPNIYFIDSTKEMVPAEISKSGAVAVFPDGFVQASMRIVITTRCSVNLFWFPFDRQTCHICFMSYEFSDAEQELRWIEGAEEEVYLPASTAKFLVTKVTTSREVMQSHVNFTRLCVNIFLKRKLTTYLVNMYLPSVALVVLSWISFYMDKHAIPARASLTITTILAQITLITGSANRFPEVSDVKVADIYLITNFFFVFGSLIEFAVVNNQSRLRQALLLRTARGLTGRDVSQLLEGDKGRVSMVHEALVTELQLNKMFQGNGAAYSHDEPYSLEYASNLPSVRPATTPSPSKHTSHSKKTCYSNLETCVPPLLCNIDSRHYNNHKSYTKTLLSPAMTQPPIKEVYSTSSAQFPGNTSPYPAGKCNQAPSSAANKSHKSVCLSPEVSIPVHAFGQSESSHSEISPGDISIFREDTFQSVSPDHENPGSGAHALEGQSSLYMYVGEPLRTRGMTATRPSVSEADRGIFEMYAADKLDRVLYRWDPDHVSRVIFPLTFVVWNIGHFLVAVYGVGA